MTLIQDGRCLGCGKPNVIGLYCARCLRGEINSGMIAVPAPLLEADTQQAVVEALTLAGWSVWRVGQRNAKGTTDPGVSDLICCRERVVFVEVKRAEFGVQREDQVKFMLAVERAGGDYRIARGIDDVRDMLERPRAPREGHETP